MVQEFRPDKKLLYHNVVMNEKQQRYINVVYGPIKINGCIIGIKDVVIEILKTMKVKKIVFG